VVVEVAGERYELQELTKMPTEIEEVKFLFERNRLSLRSVKALVEEGGKLVTAGQFETALDIFQKAARNDPYDPDPHYQSGMSLLHLQRYKAAADSFAQTERLAPGWFHCRSELWLAQQLATGKISHSTFLLLRELEDGPSSPEEKVHLAGEGLDAAGALAPLHLLQGENLLAIGNREDAKATFQRGLSCAAEPDVETRLLVDLATLVEPKDAREQLLRQAVTLNGNLVSAATAAVLLRHHIQ
jgi:tetratricopeptide (TPR) repeat protein